MNPFRLIPLALLPLSLNATLPAPEEHLENILWEVQTGLEARNLQPEFQLYLDWTANRLDESEGEKTWGDKTGNCRLAVVDQMLRDPLGALALSEEMSRLLYEGTSPDSLQSIWTLTSGWMDADPGTKTPHTEEGALNLLQSSLAAGYQEWQRALAPLTEEELSYLEEHLYPVSTGNIRVGHRFANQSRGRQVCDLLEKISRTHIVHASQRLSQLAEHSYLEMLKAELLELPSPSHPSLEHPGVDGEIRHILETPHGTILVGGTGPNTYRLEEMKEVIAVIDLGGEDTYIEGQVGPERPLLVIIDLGDDNDTFTGELPGIQGGSILGLSLLVVEGGDNQFNAMDVAQGSTLAGLGMLVAHGGNNRYTGKRRVQGSAIAGWGILLDFGGNDHYRAALLGQGVGGPLGLGLLLDNAGDNEFYGGGYYDNSYGDSAGFEGWSQGVGVGPRGVANGGIGLLLAGGGDNLYECDYFSHGGGYWFALGIARDFSGNDQRVGATRNRFDGSERGVRRFLRWGIAWQAHYGIGIVIDDEGDDFYHGNHASMAFSWDIGLAAILDFAGNDRFENARGQGAEAGVGILYAGGGTNEYTGNQLGHARPTVTYHPMPDAGGNFSFAIDYGTDSQFPDDLEGGTVVERGSTGGFFISRPGGKRPQESASP